MRIHLLRGKIRHVYSAALMRILIFLSLVGTLFITA